MFLGIHSSQQGGAAPPVGRIFNIGAGSGVLNIDLDDTGADWYPLQANDTFVVAPGTYEYIWIGTEDSSGKWGPQVNITSTGLVIADTIYTWGSVENLKLDFNNKGGNPQALRLVGDIHFEFGEEWDGPGILPIKNVVIDGFESIPQDGSGRIVRFRGGDIDHNFGSGDVAIDGLTFKNFKVTLPEDGETEWLFDFQGTLEDGDDTGFVRNVVFDNGLWEGNSCWVDAAIVIGNSTDSTAPAVFNRLFVENINNERENGHARLFQVYGCVISDACGGKDFYGNLIAVFAQTRGSTKFVNTITNLKCDHTWKYSAIECQVFSWKVFSGVVGGNYLVSGCTVKDMGLEGDYDSTLVEIYDIDGGTVYGYNNVAINPKGYATVGNLTGGSNNVVYANITAAGVNSDLIPQSGSPLIGAGVQRDELTHDFNGTVRANPPTIGAYEAD